MADSMAFSQDAAVLLAQLAEAAAQDLVLLPDGWDLLEYVKSDGSQEQPVPVARGFYARGKLELDGPTVAVLALAVPWLQVLRNLYSQTLKLVPPPAGVADGVADALFDSRLTPMYAQVRASIWRWVHFTSGLSLYVTGTGAGAPLAQLAAVDLRPGNKGPASEKPPNETPVCYAFSCPLAANSGFATFYSSKVASSYTVNLATTTLDIDFFPTAPTGAEGFAALGVAKPISSKIPVPDDPWVERSVNQYVSALGGVPDPPPQFPASIPSPPAGFSQGLAFAFSKLTAVAYGRRQHPDLPIELNINPYVFKQDIKVKGKALCSLFTGPDSVVAAFPGTITWRDMLLYQGNTWQAQATFFSTATVFISKGVVDFYTAQVSDDPKSPQFRSELAAALEGMLAGKNLNLYLTGHDLGGVLAIVAAADLLSNKNLTTTQIYTFGSQPPGDYSFATFYNGSYGANTFAVVRPADFAPKANPLNSYAAVGKAVQLRGVPPNDDATQHSITSYMQLLNPSGVGVFAEE